MYLLSLLSVDNRLNVLSNQLPLKVLEQHIDTNSSHLATLSLQYLRNAISTHEASCWGIGDHRSQILNNQKCQHDCSSHSFVNIYAPASVLPPKRQAFFSHKIPTLVLDLGHPSHLRWQVELNAALNALVTVSTEARSCQWRSHQKDVKVWNCCCSLFLSDYNSLRKEL